MSVVPCFSVGREGWCESNSWKYYVANAFWSLTPFAAGDFKYIQIFMVDILCFSLNDLVNFNPIPVPLIGKSYYLQASVRLNWWVSPSVLQSQFRYKPLINWQKSSSQVFHMQLLCYSEMILSKTPSHFKCNWCLCSFDKSGLFRVQHFSGISLYWLANEDP